MKGFGGIIIKDLQKEQKHTWALTLNAKLLDFNDSLKLVS